MFPNLQLTISYIWFREWLGARGAISHYLNQWWPIVWWRICMRPSPPVSWGLTHRIPNKIGEILHALPSMKLFTFKVKCHWKIFPSVWWAINNQNRCNWWQGVCTINSNGHHNIQTIIYDTWIFNCATDATNIACYLIQKNRQTSVLHSFPTKVRNSTFWYPRVWNPNV